MTDTEHTAEAGLMPGAMAELTPPEDTGRGQLPGGMAQMSGPGFCVMPPPVAEAP